ncbi:hypothetical protein TP2_17050 [Thioclava pacifica DSM 10166]|uniref:Uncharacterized protein n=1 Tax=Thioclava pacifica DSM 10166 TaxID=1353537 RepID=A0A074JZN8_9RHOB|nr:hypothetical protein TP2_17050 [Thioclava pacifica DSM 10166]
MRLNERGLGFPFLGEPRMILMHAIADAPSAEPAIDPVHGRRLPQTYARMRLTSR